MPTVDREEPVRAHGARLPGARGDGRARVTPRAPDQPWLVDVEDVAASLRTDLRRGLTADEAARRLAATGPNRIEPEPPVPGWRKFLAQFADPLVVLLFAAVLISLATWALDGAEGVPLEAVVIALILVANAVLGYVQEARAERAVEALQRMAAPHATVLRDGIEQRVAVDEVVPGDVLVLAEGDEVSADARLFEAATLTVAEAALTGESEPVLKDASTLEGEVALGDRFDMVFSGTAVTRGRGRAVVTATGMATEMGRIATLLSRTEAEATPLQREISHVGKLLGVAVVVIAVVVVAVILLTSEIEEAADVVDVLLIGVSLAVAAVPEGLPAVLSIVLALGVQRMARSNAIVKELSSVETLGSASVICTDKTGTLTRNEMTIQRIVTHSGTVDVTGIGYEPVGELLADGKPLEGPLLEECRIALTGGALASDATLRREGDDWVVTGDPTEAAFLVAERKAGFAEERFDRFERVGEIPFTSERKMMSTFQADAARDGGIAVVTKGAPDVLLPRCTRVQVGGETRALDDAERARFLDAVEQLAGDALRTLAVAYRPLETDAPPPPDPAVEEELILVGVVGIIDPPREEVKGAIDEAHHAGIRVMMITGDHPRTAQRIGAELGVIGPDDRSATGVELDALDDAAFADTVREVSVFARVSPDHKLRIVDALQADGNIVAMTGDGVNDAPALKSADIGVAMGITGTDVTKEAAQMVLADDNFATIVAAVREGRSIFSNIRKFLRYLLSSNVGEVLTMLLGVVFAGVMGLDADGGIAVPLLATQILWINLLTDTGPALAMGVDPPPDDVMERPPRRTTERVIDGRMQRKIVFVGAVMAVVSLLALDVGLPGGIHHGAGSIDEARTLAFTTLVLAQLFNCVNARSDRVSAFHHLFTNPLLWGAIALSVALQVLVVYVPWMQEAFGTTSLSIGEWALCIALASVVLWAEELRKLAERAIERSRAARAGA